MTQAVPLRVLSTLGVAGIVRTLLPEAAARGFAPEFRFDPTARLLAAIREGAQGDVAILTGEGVGELAEAGVLVAATRRELARSFIGAAVRAGAPRPDIGTDEAFRRTLLSVPSLAYSRAGASGIFFAGLIERLGIAAEVNAKARIIPHGFTAELAARGEVALAIQQVSELMAVPGVDILGKLPPGMNTGITFAAACFADAPPAAGDFIAWLEAAMTPAVLRAGGLEPVGAP
ncbi:molybdate ABC transporter substrate-binding protein [Falsiroseomonas bella]|uniref:Molybdate ABC transporter substrate-binding protein n=1 Tax=Falsiroseomonas bella TaxID=2184016 RepID=A0A317FAH5_9PROT|nr:substrate-binding domain-containing protein [Falsiroseomonas bella]PWS35027.1 molybdate ABC transporter substrate-binding protein [Falsiroseomonas bella]